MDLSTSYFRSNSEQNDKPASASKPLYIGASSDLTLYAANVLLLKYALKHSLTTVAFKELLHLLSVFLPKNANIPKNAKQLKKYFMEIHSEQKPSMQDYCSHCLGLMEAGKSCHCGAKKSQFVTVPLGPQIKARLESKDF